MVRPCQGTKKNRRCLFLDGLWGVFCETASSQTNSITRKQGPVNNQVNPLGPTNRQGIRLRDIRYEGV